MCIVTRRVFEVIDAFLSDCQLRVDAGEIQSRTLHGFYRPYSSARNRPT